LPGEGVWRNGLATRRRFMRCREFEDRMNDLLDQRHAPERDELLVRHAGQCPDCGRMLQGQAALFAGLEVLESPQPSRRFASAVLAQSVDAPVAAVVVRPAKARKWMGIAAGLISVAAAFVVVYLGFFHGQQNVA